MNLWRILCLLQLMILQQVFPLTLLIITVIETKRRYKESPTVTPLWRRVGEIVSKIVAKRKITAQLA